MIKKNQSKKQIQKNAKKYCLSISDLARQFLLNGQSWAKSNHDISDGILDKKR